MSLSEGEIMARLRKWVSSPEGQKRIAEKVSFYRNGGDSHVNSTGKTYGGSRIVTYDQMESAAEKFIEIVRTNAASAGLPPSVMAHIESFYAAPIVINEDGSATIDISMADNPHRDSLQPETYKRGADNIVALFNKGYNAKGSIYGLWESRGEEVWSRKSREGLNFLQAAMNEFNANYGAKYNVTVTIDSQYK